MEEIVLGSTVLAAYRCFNPLPSLLMEEMEVKTKGRPIALSCFNPLPSLLMEEICVYLIEWIQ